jgi:hypothetical protein
MSLPVTTYSGIPALGPDGKPLTTITFDETEELPDGVSFTYVAKAVFAQGAVGTGPASEPATVVARNDAPVANADGPSVEYTTIQESPLTIPVRGVLTNDTDADSPSAGSPTFSLKVASPRPITGPTNGTLTLNENGSFSYRPVKGFFGTDTFTYKANDGTWSGLVNGVHPPLSPDSTPATVTITVLKGKK